MTSLARRQFLSSSLGGFAAACTAGRSLFAEETKTPAQAGPEKSTGPDTLILTWQQDPTTTMTVQWVAPATDAETSIHYAPLADDSVWLIGKTIAKPYV